MANTMEKRNWIRYAIFACLSASFVLSVLYIVALSQTKNNILKNVLPILIIGAPITTSIGLGLTFTSGDTMSKAFSLFSCFVLLPVLIVFGFVMNEFIRGYWSISFDGTITLVTLVLGGFAISVPWIFLLWFVPQYASAKSGALTTLSCCLCVMTPIALIPFLLSFPKGADMLRPTFFSSEKSPVLFVFVFMIGTALLSIYLVSLRRVWIRQDQNHQINFQRQLSLNQIEEQKEKEQVLAHARQGNPEPAFSFELPFSSQQITQWSFWAVAIVNVLLYAVFLSVNMFANISTVSKITSLILAVIIPLIFTACFSLIGSSMSLQKKFAISMWLGIFLPVWGTLPIQNQVRFIF